MKAWPYALLAWVIARVDYELGHVLFGYALALLLLLATALAGGWQLLIKLAASISLYELFWLALLPRLSRAVFIDAPWRWFSKNIIPLLFLDARNRALVQKRAGLLKDVCVQRVSAVWEAVRSRLEPVFGRRSTLVMCVVLATTLLALLFLLGGFTLVFFLLPQWAQKVLLWPVRGVMFLLRMLMQSAKQIAVRMGLFFLFAKFWDRYGFKILAERHRRHIRRRHRALVRAVIERRRRTGQKLDGLRAWEKFKIVWFPFWDRRFAPLEAAQKSAGQETGKAGAVR